MAETQRNAPVMKKLLELHYGFQTRLMCPIDLLVRNILVFDQPVILKFMALGERS